jgi:hypothetical protein
MTIRRSAPHAKGRWSALAVVAAIMLLVGAQAVLANLTGSTFEGSDGNLVVDTTGNHDWANAPNIDTKVDRPSGGTDDSFGQGAKEDISNPAVVSGSIPPNKSDLTRFYVAHEKVSANTFLYLAWERSNVLGSANMDFEFNQSSTIDANGVTPVRTNGDMLITFDFVNGGGTPVLGSLRWLVAGQPDPINPLVNTNKSSCYSANKLPCWGDRIDLSAAGLAEGAVNTAVVTDPIAPNAPRSLPAGTFGEAALNISSILGSGANSCTSFGSAYLKSRSAASFPAELKDFIAPTTVNISNCGSITIVKNTTGGDETFGYTSDNDDLPGPADANGDFTITTSDGTGEADFTDVTGGTYNVSEDLGNLPAHWTFGDVGCVASTGSSFLLDQDTATATITLAAGGEVTCTFTNSHEVASPTIATTLSDESIAIGDSIHDSATLTSATGDAGGSVTYTVYTDSSCSAPAVAGTDIDAQPAAGTVAAGIVSDSGDVQFLHAGDFYWQAVYDGDANNNGATSVCSSEHLVVSPNEPGIGTAQNLLPNDDATISGATATAGGDVHFYLFNPENPTCDMSDDSDASTYFVFDQSIAVSGDGTYSTTNTSFLASAEGTWRWLVVYSGDDDNVGTQSNCGTERFTITN